MKNLEELENKGKIKEILDTRKIIISQRQPRKSLKNTHMALHLVKTQHKEFLNAIINDPKYVI